MGSAHDTKKLSFSVSDISGQHSVSVSGFPEDASVGEMVRGLIGKMGLSPRDINGRDYAYHARSERTGRHLNPAEIVGDVVLENDELVLSPNIDAGGR